MTNAIKVLLQMTSVSLQPVPTLSKVDSFHSRFKMAHACQKRPTRAKKGPIYTRMS
jgi:hypothetical protein